MLEDLFLLTSIPSNFFSILKKYVWRKIGFYDYFLLLLMLSDQGPGMVEWKPWLCCNGSRISMMDNDDAFNLASIITRGQCDEEGGWREKIKNLYASVQELTDLWIYPRINTSPMCLLQCLPFCLTRYPNEISCK